MVKKNQEVEVRRDAPPREYKRQSRGQRRYQHEYWQKVWESDGFDIDHLPQTHLYGLKVYKCDEGNYYPVVIKLFAQLGLYWYNQKKNQGTKLQFVRVEKYNIHNKYMPSCYYITSVVLDPDSGHESYFQTSIVAKMSTMHVRCDLARPKPKVTKRVIFPGKNAPQFEKVRVPEWPSNLKEGYYELQKSEWEEKEWICLYLELAFATTHPLILTPTAHPLILTPKLSDLKIVKVFVETKDKEVDLPTAVYIMYDHNLGDGRVSKHTAIVTTSVDQASGRFCLVGQVSKPL